MENNKQYEIKSLRERLFLKEFLDECQDITQIKYTDYNGTDLYDATWIQWHPTIKACWRVIAEVKVRNYPMTAYAGWLIEKPKYDFLKSQNYEKRLYINIHPDGIQIWDLDKADEPQWKETPLPKNNQDEETKMKINGDLMSGQAQVIKKQHNIFEMLNKASEIWIKRNK